MRKENIFLVTLRAEVGTAGPTGIEQVVICAPTQEAMHEFAVQAFPRRQVLGAASMSELESTLHGLRQALECKPGAHAVFVDPRMKKVKAPTQH